MDAVAAEEGERWETDLSYWLSRKGDAVQTTETDRFSGHLWTNGVAYP